MSLFGFRKKVDPVEEAKKVRVRTCVFVYVCALALGACPIIYLYRYRSHARAYDARAYTPFQCPS